MPEVGLEPGSSPRKHRELPKTCRVRASPANVRLGPADKVCTLCTHLVLQFMELTPTCRAAHRRGAVLHFQYDKGPTGGSTPPQPRNRLTRCGISAQPARQSSSLGSSQRPSPFDPFDFSRLRFPAGPLRLGCRRPLIMQTTAENHSDWLKTCVAVHGIDYRCRVERNLDSNSEPQLERISSGRVGEAPPTRFCLVPFR